MNAATSSERIRLLLLALLGISFALGSLWLLEVLRHEAANASAAGGRTDPDYFVENFNFIKAATTGQARYALAGTKLTHFPKDDTYEIALPIMKSLSADHPPLTMRAQRALANSDATQVQMIDDVQIDRPASPTAPHFHLTSTYMKIFPDEDVMQTDRAVDITQGTTELAGTGMYANNATLAFSLASGVHSITQPHPH